MKERWFENLNEVKVEAERQKMKRFILFTRPRAAGPSTTLPAATSTPPPPYPFTLLLVSSK
jgi:hypothetical protein